MGADLVFAMVLALLVLMVAAIIQLVFFAAPPPTEDWETAPSPRTSDPFKPTILAAMGLLSLFLLIALLYSALAPMHH